MRNRRLSLGTTKAASNWPTASLLSLRVKIRRKRSPKRSTSLSMTRKKPPVPKDSSLTKTKRLIPQWDRAEICSASTLLPSPSSPQTPRICPSPAYLAILAHRTLRRRQPLKNQPPVCSLTISQKKRKTPSLGITRTQGPVSLAMIKRKSRSPYLEMASPQQEVSSPI